MGRGRITNQQQTIAVIQQGNPTWCVTGYVDNSQVHPAKVKDMTFINRKDFCLVF